MPKNHATPPALGERRAISGYGGQYRVAAFLIYRALLSNDLEALRVADPEAGRVDDLQILLPGRLDAYQIKWSQHPAAISFKDLLTPTQAKKPSLANQLADGWKRLRRQDSGRRVVVHLLTNDFPSPRDRVPILPSSKGSRHFAAFFADYLQYTGKGLPLPEPSRWQPAVESLQRVVGLTPEEFVAFLTDLRLDLSFAFPEPAFLDSHEGSSRDQDLRQLEHWLFRVVGEPRQRVELSRADLLRELGWEGRLKLRHRHEIPDPSIHYSPVEGTAHQLEHAFAKLTSGYLAVLGTPGSGKSTLLTQMLRFSRERVLRYYAFVPDSHEIGQPRGEAESFLHDMVLSLDQSGFRTGESLLQADLDLLGKRFSRQLEMLGDDWGQTGRKTILLVDGLDHIQREQRPTRSLLSVLPEPGQLPAGVLIVLGSQTDQLAGLSAAIKLSLEQPERRLAMQALSRGAVREIVVRSGLDAEPSPEETEQIFQLSGGHPLALAYLLNQIRGQAPRPIADRLKATLPYDGMIDNQYLAHWERVKSDYELVHLLALLARARGALDLPWLRSWANREALHRVTSELAHFFHPEPGDRWFFFHNSFQLFLRQRTADLPALSAGSGEQDLFRELAEAAADSLETSAQSWDEIFYRVAAGELQRALSLASGDRFRQQLMRGRPWEAIRDDLHLLIPFVIEQQDLPGLARLLLCAKEFAERAHNLQEVDAAQLLAELGDTRAASEWARQGRYLRMEPQEALDLAQILAREGQLAEGGRVFELAEPLDLLTGGRAVEYHLYSTQKELLCAWGRSVPYFRDIAEILRRVEAIHFEPVRENQARQSETIDALKSHVRLAVGDTLRTLGRWGDLDAVASAWNPKKQEDRSHWLYFYLEAAREAHLQGELGIATKLLKRVVASTARRSLHWSDRLVLADSIWRVTADLSAAKNCLRNVALPHLSDIAKHSSRIGRHFLSLQMVHRRILAALGDNRSLNEIVPDALNSRDQPVVYFERSLLTAARLWGVALAGRPVPVLEFGGQCGNVLRSIMRRAELERTSWYQVAPHRDLLIDVLIRAAQAHGSEAVESLRVILEEQWSEPEQWKSWPVDLVLSVLSFLARAGLSQEWLSWWLRKTQEQAAKEPNVPSRCEFLAQSVRCWRDLGKPDQAREALSSLFRYSLAVHQKDNQTSYWVSLAHLANKADPKGAPTRLRLLAAAIPDLEDKEVISHAVEPLIEAAWQWQPRAGTELFQWLLERGLVHFDSGLRVLLKEAAQSATSIRTLCAISEHLLLPLVVRSAPVELIESLCAKGCLTSEKRAVLGSLARGILISALGSLRPALSDAMEQGSARAGATWHETLSCLESDLRSLLQKARNANTERWALSSVTVEPEAGSDARTYSFKTIEEVEAALDSGGRSLSNMRRALEAIINKADQPDLERLTTIARKLEDNAAVLNRLARRFLELKEKERAWSLASEAIERIHSRDSYRRYAWDDDGRLPASFRVLHAINVEKSRSLAWKILSEQLDELEGRYFYWFAERLEQMAPSLGSEVPALAFWRELEPYLKVLFPFADLESAPRFKINPEAGDAGLGALVDLVLGLLDHPIIVISHGAQRVVVDLLIAEDPLTQFLFRKFLALRPRESGRLLEALEAVASHRPQVVRPLAETLKGVAEVGDFRLRSSCRRLLASQGVELPEAAFRELPDLYRIALPHRREANWEPPVEPGRPLADTEDSVVLVSVVQNNLDLLAERAEVQPEQLYTRVVQLASAGRGLSTAAEETRLGQKLNQADFRLPFRRTRTGQILGGMWEATQELIAAGSLQERDRYLEPLLTFSDPEMLFLRPTVRPAEISLIEERAVEEYLKPGWTQGVDVNVSAVLCSDPDKSDWITVAEETVIRWLDWNVPTEIRAGVIIVQPPPIAWEQETEDLLGEACLDWSHRLARNYGRFPSPEPALVGLRNGQRFDSPGGRFLAFSPRLARWLGWCLAPDGLFRWIDESQTVMVESIWWADGCVSLGPPEPKDEVGEGWLVRVSQSGWRALREVFPQLTCCVAVSRTANEQQKRVATRSVLAIR